MNRRSFFGSVLAAPIAAAMGWKSRPLTYSSLWDAVKHLRPTATGTTTVVTDQIHHDDVIKILAEQGKAAGESHKAMTTQRMAEIVSESTKKAFGDAWK